MLLIGFYYYYYFCVEKLKMLTICLVLLETRIESTRFPKSSWFFGCLWLILGLLCRSIPVGPFSVYLRSECLRSMSL
ncbi:hypothetical protein BJ165DRAFT_1454025 [Panaeolus papilionaceus]|nr:hypothetical protein BJ165DRAFT_1454025 [Panaeolus papilionaceus]